MLEIALDRRWPLVAGQGEHGLPLSFYARALVAVGIPTEAGRRSSDRSLTREVPSLLQSW